MNYYELSNTVTPDTIGYKNGLWQKRYVQIYRVLTVVWSVLTLCLLFGMFHRDDYSSGMIKSCLLLFFAGIIFLVLMLIAVVNISAKRTENWSLQDRHDYNLAMYRTRYRNNRQLQSVVLIVMAKQQLLMSNYDLAAQALAMVDINCVKLPYLRDYYFCNAAVLSFIVMFKKYDLLRTSREDYYMDWNGIWRMLSIGLQMALNYSITAIGTMIFQAAVNVFGSQVVAAYTAASKVSNIATQTMPTLGTAAATYCGQNLGAGRYDRIFKGMKSCFFICIGCAVLAAAINCFVGPYMIGWFITSPTATDIDCAMKYLKIASVFMLPLAWIFAYRNGLQGLNKGLVPMLSGGMELVSRWIAILALSKPFGYVGVCFADPAAWLTTGILLIVTYYVWEMRMRKKIQIK
jgi:hypothetical protein